MPQMYMINSTDEFKDIRRTTEPKGTIASLDVKSHFINVLIMKTFDIISHNWYYNPTLIKPKILKQDPNRRNSNGKSIRSYFCKFLISCDILKIKLLIKTLGLIQFIEKQLKIEKNTL